jgi:hypothetical protein
LEVRSNTERIGLKIKIRTRTERCIIKFGQNDSGIYNVECNRSQRENSNYDGKKEYEVKFTKKESELIKNSMSSVLLALDVYNHWLYEDCRNKKGRWKFPQER